VRLPLFRKTVDQYCRDLLALFVGTLAFLFMSPRLAEAASVSDFSSETCFFLYMEAYDAARGADSAAARGKLDAFVQAGCRARSGVILDDEPLPLKRDDFRGSACYFLYRDTGQHLRRIDVAQARKTMGAYEDAGCRKGASSPASRQQTAAANGPGPLLRGASR